LLAAVRALDCLRPLASSPIIEQVRTGLAQISAPWIADRALTADIEAASAWIAAGELSRHVPSRQSPEPRPQERSNPK